MVFLFFLYVLDRKIKAGPDAAPGGPPDKEEIPGLAEAVSRRGKTQHGLVDSEKESPPC